ncbi:hypothetical protein SAMN05421594_4672 [Chryseobacterium oleae]|uniref:Uncharacterized protein n=1 Tax=Chryseobacterium oleae TaxID=491207 RepID=A0A1I5CTX8_CHROL|nr:hypothetical protein [Chryseobacterium oleae]SFN90394.1 hypothetical protein SAMN05421594_4672 [Chryseobacterium oleae]
MSKKKLLIHEVFEKARKDFPAESTKNGWCKELVDHFEKKLKFIVNEKTFVRYYDACLRDNKEPSIKDIKILNKLSEYLGYKDFTDFSRTFVKNDENAKKTIFKVSIDEKEEIIPMGNSGLVINLTNTVENTQTFKMPEFMKQNGLGIMEIALLLCLVTGNIVFSSNKKVSHGSSFPLGFMADIQSGIDKKYMYWNGERYIGTDSSFIRPGLDVKAMNEHLFQYFKKIKRKDTLTEQNALGTTWYSKYYNEVEFFTEDGVDPENGRELKRSTPTIIYKYAGKPKDSIEIEE